MVRVRRSPVRSPWFPRIGLGLAVVLLGWGVVSLAVGQGGPRRFVVHGTEIVQQLYGGVRQDGVRLGDPDAPVTIGVFNDLQCSSCRHYELHVVDPLVADYARGSTAQLEFHNLSLGGTDTTVAAYAATAAGNQGREWQYVDFFFRNQAEVPQHGVDSQFLDDIANEIPDFDLPRWRHDQASEKVKAAVSSDAKLAIDYRLPAEPAIVVSGPGGSKTLEESPSKAKVDAAVRAAE
jgi:protein-disulfide isomerase